MDSFTYLQRPVGVLGILLLVHELAVADDLDLPQVLGVRNVAGVARTEDPGRFAPGMDRDLKGRASEERWDKAAEQRRSQVSAGILEGEASRAEFLHGRLAFAREEEDVPVLESHAGAGR